MSINLDGGEKLGVVSTIDPVTITSTQVYGDGVDMSKYHQVTFIFSLGDMASETIDALVQSDTAAAHDDTPATLKSATQLAAHATNNDNKQIVITVRSEDLPTGDRYVRPSMVTGGATGGPASCVGLAHDVRHGLASDSDLATVVEIVR